MKGALLPSPVWYTHIHTHMHGCDTGALLSACSVRPTETHTHAWVSYATASYVHAYTLAAHYYFYYPEASRTYVCYAG